MASRLEVSSLDHRSVVLLASSEIIYLKEREGRSQAKEICFQETSLSYSKGPFTPFNGTKYTINSECNRCKPSKVQS